MILKSLFKGIKMLKGSLKKTLSKRKDRRPSYGILVTKQGFLLMSKFPFVSSPLLVSPKKKFKLYFPYENGPTKVNK